MSEKMDGGPGLRLAETNLLMKTELPIRYTVPFEWGTISVTEAANEAYSFTPLREGVQQGGIEPEEREGFIDVRIIGPGEVPESEHRGNPGLFMSTGLHRGRLALQAGFHDGADTDLEKAKGVLQGIIDADDEEFAEMMEVFESSSEDLPEELAERQQLSQLLVHSLYAAIPQPIINAYSDIERHDLNRSALRRSTFLGSAILAMGGANALMLGNNVTGEVVLGAYAATGFWAARSIMKAHFADISGRERRIGADAELIAETVGEGIHETYCLAHFDYENRQRLLGED